VQFLNSIRNKLVLAFAVVTLPPLIALGWYGGSQIEAMERTRGHQSLETRIDQLSAQVERFLAGIDGDLLLLADTPALAQYLLAVDSGDPALVEAARNNLALAFVRLVEIRGAYHQVRYIDATGAERIRVDHDADVTVVAPTERLQRQPGPDFEEAQKLPKGEVVVSAVELKRDGNNLEEPHRPLLRYATPVFDAHSRRRGVLVIAVAVEPVLQSVSASAGRGETLLFVDAGGAYLSHPDSSKLWGRDGDLATGESLLKDYPELGPRVVATDALFREEGDGLLTLAKPVSIPGLKGRSLGVLVNLMRTDVLYETATGFRTAFNALALVGLLLALAVGSIVAHLVTRPIVALPEAVDRMSKGDLDRPIEATSHDETEKLASSMERLRKSMKLMLEKFE
jgi:methyl-accepting chemotaxis protein